MDWDKAVAKAQVRVGVKSSEENLDSESETALMNDNDATESDCELLVPGSHCQVVVARHRVLAFGVVVRLAHPLHHDFRNSTLCIQLNTIVINVAPVL